MSANDKPRTLERLAEHWRKDGEFFTGQNEPKIAQVYAVCAAQLDAAMAAHQAEKAAPYAWGVSGIDRLFFGEDAALDAVDEARRIGGTAEAFPLYRHAAPAAPVAVALTNQEAEDVFRRCGGQWRGDKWAIGNGDMHTFVLALAARWGVKLEGGE